MWYVHKSEKKCMNANTYMYCAECGRKAQAPVKALIRGTCNGCNVSNGHEAEYEPKKSRLMELFKKIGSAVRPAQLKTEVRRTPS